MSREDYPTQIAELESSEISEDRAYGSGWSASYGTHVGSVP
jgi:hypothetical protein